MCQTLLDAVHAVPPLYSPTESESIVSSFANQEAESQGDEVSCLGSRHLGGVGSGPRPSLSLHLGSLRPLQASGSTCRANFLPGPPMAPPPGR